MKYYIFRILQFLIDLIVKFQNTTNFNKKKIRYISGKQIYTCGTFIFARFNFQISIKSIKIEKKRINFNHEISIKYIYFNENHLLFYWQKYFNTFSISRVVEVD